METKSQFSLLLVGDKSTVVTMTPLLMDSLLPLVAGPDKGAVVTFSGTVRDLENGSKISALEYEAYVSMAEKEIWKIMDQTEKKWPVSIAVQHRIGSISVGQSSLVVACAGVHRREAFEACEFVVDEIKIKVPIWKAGFEWL